MDTTAPATHRPPDEDARLAAVRRFDILDTPPDGAFDRITALAARFCDVPISTVTIVDHDRIWFKSVYGVDVEQVGRDPGLCASAILEQGPYAVTDAATDPRTLDNPLVRGDLGLRFYVAVPLTTDDGHNLGTLNIIDTEPREVTRAELDTLHDLAAIVMDELHLRLAASRTIELHAQRTSSELRDAIITGVSHEMRTPMAVLRALSSLEAAEEVEDVEERKRRHMMRRQVTHLDWLVSQFLDYARITDERSLGLRPTAFPVPEVVEAACDVFAERAPVTIEHATPRTVAFADRDRTRQALIELLNNAVRFGPTDAPVRVEITADEAWVRVAVVDHGPGIDPADHGRVFDKYYRDTTSTGAGVGLYVTRWCAEAQGGRVELDSTRGQGSRFTLVLPAASAEEAREGVEAPDAPAREG